LARPERNGISPFDQTRQEHRVELEPLRAVIREQVHAPTAVLGGEAARELGAERRCIPAGMRALELGRERAHPREVGLARDLFVGIR
jgi:hypothetical protein